MGGEKPAFRQVYGLLIGSPPHGRGKADRGRPGSVGWGITPAWAGKRPLIVSVEIVHEDHPRVGGEKMLTGTSTDDETGSPPRGRGKVLFTCPWYPDVGITPAWAGKREQQNLCTNVREDHPRVGGEKGGPLAALRRNRGSPPRGRGKVISMKRWAPTQRITPAWAGKSI